MQNFNVISKGNYIFPQSDPLLTIQDFIFFSENGKKYLLLKWKNGRNEVLNGLRLTISFYDASEELIGKKELSFENLRYEANSSFVLEPKIEVAEDCVDFAVGLDLARYGNYTYSSGKNGVVADYHRELPHSGGRRLPAKKTTEQKEFDVAVARPALPRWVGILFCVVLVCLIAVAYQELDIFKGRYYRSFLKGGVEYTFIYDGNEPTELHVTGYHGKGRHVTIPDAIEGLPVTEIESNAFAENNKVESVTLNGGLKIRSAAFSLCRNLTSINLENVTAIGNAAFFSCGLRSVTANHLTEIGDSAFSRCEALDSVLIRNPVTPLTLGSSPFSYCDGLRTVTIDQFVEYSDEPDIFEGVQNVETLELKNFPPFGHVDKTISSLFGYGDARALKNLKIGDIEKVSQEFCSNTPVERVEIGHVTEPTIGDYAFRECRYLKELVLPPIEQIGEGAFYNCRSLSNFQLPESLVSIGYGAFNYCTALTELTLPPALENIGSNAFEHCYRLFEVKNESRLDLSVDPSMVGLVTEYALKVYGAEEEFAPKAETDGYSFMLTENGWYMIGYPQDSATLNLPQSFWHGETVSRYKVPDHLFYGSEYLTKVTIPTAVEEIGAYAFLDCTGLQTVLFVGESSLTVLREGIFSRTDLREITLPEGIRSIELAAFRDCAALQSVVLPQSLTDIGEQVFLSCENLRTVYNLSALSLVKGSESYGYVAYYAENIYTSLDKIATIG